MEQIAEQYAISLAADTLESDNSKSHQSVTMRKLCFFMWVFTTQLTVYGASKYESHEYFWK